MEHGPIQFIPHPPPFHSDSCYEDSRLEWRWMASRRRISGSLWRDRRWLLPESCLWEPDKAQASFPISLPCTAFFLQSSVLVPIVHGQSCGPYLSVTPITKRILFPLTQACALGHQDAAGAPEASREQTDVIMPSKHAAKVVVTRKRVRCRKPSMYLFPQQNHDEYSISLTRGY